MASVKLLRWGDNAEVILAWSEEGDIIQAVATSNQQVIFQAHLSDVESYQTRQTFLNEVAIEIQIAGNMYQFYTKIKESPSWTSRIPAAIRFFVTMITYSLAKQEKRIGISDLRRILMDNHVKVRRTNYPRNVILALSAGFLIKFIIDKVNYMLI